MLQIFKLYSIGYLTEYRVYVVETGVYTIEAKKLGFITNKFDIRGNGKLQQLVLLLRVEKVETVQK